MARRSSTLAAARGQASALGDAADHGWCGAHSRYFWRLRLRNASPLTVGVDWRRPWRAFAALDRDGRRLLIAWGAVLAVMNACFYTAISRLPLSTVAAIEFLPVIALAALGACSRRSLLALALAVGGVYVLTDVELAAEPVGLAFAFANALLFALYIVLADRVAKRPQLSGIDGLAAAMLIALVVITPIGGWQAASAFLNPTALLAGVGVGVSSSVIPYVTDQLAMARLARASYALMVALLPALATLTGIIVLGQIPSWAEVGGIALVIAGVALHRRPAQHTDRPPIPKEIPARAHATSNPPTQQLTRKPHWADSRTHRPYYRHRASPPGLKRPARLQDRARDDELRRHIEPRLGADEHAAEPIVSRAIKAEVTFFDTADMYANGAAEIVTGRLLAKLIPREQAVVSIKVFYPTTPGPNGRGLSRKHVMAAIDPSLERLQMDYRRPLPDPPLGSAHADRGNDGSTPRRIKARQARYLGASRWPPGSSPRHKRPRNEAAGHASSPSRTTTTCCTAKMSTEWSRSASTRASGPIPYSPLARGQLARRTHNEPPSARAQGDPVRASMYGQPGDEEVIASLQHVAQQRGSPPAQVALAWLLQRPQDHSTDRRSHSGLPDRWRDRSHQAHAEPRRDLLPWGALHSPPDRPGEIVRKRVELWATPTSSSGVRPEIAADPSPGGGPPQTTSGRFGDHHPLIGGTSDSDRVTASSDELDPGAGARARVDRPAGPGVARHGEPAGKDRGARSSDVEIAALAAHGVALARAWSCVKRTKGARGRCDRPPATWPGGSSRSSRAAGKRASGSRGAAGESVAFGQRHRPDREVHECGGECGWHVEAPAEPAEVDVQNELQRNQAGGEGGERGPCAGAAWADRRDAGLRHQAFYGDVSDHGNRRKHGEYAQEAVRSAGRSERRRNRGHARNADDAERKPREQEQRDREQQGRAAEHQILGRDRRRRRRPEVGWGGSSCGHGSSSVRLRAHVTLRFLVWKGLPRRAYVQLCNSTPASCSHLRERDDWQPSVIALCREGRPFGRWRSGPSNVDSFGLVAPRSLDRYPTRGAPPCRSTQTIGGYLRLTSSLGALYLADVGTMERTGSPRRWPGGPGGHMEERDARANGRLRIVVVDQRRLMAEALVALIGSLQDDALGEVLAITASAGAIVALAPDLVLVAVGDERDGPLALISALREQAPAIRTVIVADSSDPGLIAFVLDHDVAGLLLSDSTAADLAICLEQIAHGHTVLPADCRMTTGTYDEDSIDALSGRQFEVLALVAEGCSYAEIARRLFISVNTVKFHVRAIYQRLGVCNRMAAAHLLAEHGQPVHRSLTVR